MTATESRGGSPQDSTDTEIIDAELAADLSSLIDELERLEWHRVPDVDVATAREFTRDLVEARADIRRGV